jgi:hypothetical protein
MLLHDLTKQPSFRSPASQGVDITSRGRFRTPQHPRTFDGGQSTPSHNGGNGSTASGGGAGEDSLAATLPHDVRNDKGQPLKQKEMVMLQQFATFASDTDFMRPFKSMANAKRKASAAFSSQAAAKRLCTDDNGSPSRSNTTEAANGDQGPSLENAEVRQPSDKLRERIEARINPPPPVNPFWNNADTYCMAVLRGAEITTFEMSHALVEEYKELGTVLGCRLQVSQDQVDMVPRVLEDKLRYLSACVRRAMTDCMVEKIKRGDLRPKEDELFAGPAGPAGPTQKSRAGSVVSVDPQLSQLLVKRRGTASTIGTEAPLSLPPGHQLISSFGATSFCAKLADDSDASRKTTKGTGRTSRGKGKKKPGSAGSQTASMPYSLAPSVIKGPPPGLEPPPPVSPVNTQGPGAGLLRPRLHEKDGHNWMLVKQTGRWKYIGQAGPEQNASNTTMGKHSNRARRTTSATRLSSAGDIQPDTQRRALAPAFRTDHDPGRVEPFPLLPHEPVAEAATDFSFSQQSEAGQYGGTQTQLINHLLEQQNFMQQQMAQQQQQLMSMYGGHMGAMQLTTNFGVPVQLSGPYNAFSSNSAVESQVDPSLRPMNVPMVSQSPAVGLGIRTPQPTFMPQPRQVDGRSQYFGSLPGMGPHYSAMPGEAQALPNHTNRHADGLPQPQHLEQPLIRSGSTNSRAGDSDDVFAP